MRRTSIIVAIILAALALPGMSQSGALGVGYYATGHSYLPFATASGAAGQAYAPASSTVFGYNATGITPGSAYTSGGTISGTIGQTCTITIGGGTTNAVGTLKLATATSIAAGSIISFYGTGLTSGTGYSSAPTSGTLTNGTATCSGSVVISTTLGVYAPMAVDANGNLVVTTGTFVALSGDAISTATGGATTVVGLDGVPFSNTPSPSLGDVICYDGVQYTPCPSTPGVAQILYVTNMASSISGYDLWDTTPLGSQFTIAKTIPATTTKTLIEAFATASGYPDATVIPSGEWQADAYVQVSSGSNTTTLNIDVYDRTSGGTETLLFSFGNTTISGNGTAIQAISTEAIEPAFSLADTDLLVVKYSMTKTGGSSITGTLYGGGSNNYTHVHTPIATVSNGGVTKTCSTLITAMTVTNGVITALTCP
jgi:hypothetical protein